LNFFSKLKKTKGKNRTSASTFDSIFTYDNLITRADKMIGAMPAVAVRHERRKNKSKDRPVRPNQLQVKALLFCGREWSGEGGSKQKQV